MRTSSIHGLILSFLVLLIETLLITSTTQARPVVEPVEKSQSAQWTWADKSGRIRSVGELQTIIKQSEIWFNSGHNSGARADLSGSKLIGANLRDAMLIDADFTNSDLSGGDLTKTNLNGASLQGAKLEDTKLIETGLTGAHLIGADLTHTQISTPAFSGADLTGAKLNGTDLSWKSFTNATLKDADLSGANLTGSDLNGADLGNAVLRNSRMTDTALSNAKLEGADLYGAMYETRSNPKPKSIAFAKNLEHMTYASDSEGLSRLRQQFKETGFRNEERKITYVLRSRLGELLWEKCKTDEDRICFEYWVNRILFDFTTQYGMAPIRALKLVLGVFVFCTFMYAVLMHFLQKSGLGIVVGHPYFEIIPPWLTPCVTENWKEVRKEEVSIGRLFQIRAAPIEQATRSRSYIFLWIQRELSLIGAAIFFSLMSTFNIKFRDIDFARWLRLLTKTEYDIKAYGWARVIAGFQALISVYLIGLAILTYFGRPFE